MNWKTLASAIILASGLAATAHATDATGKITEINPTTRMVTLDDGKTYDFSSPECQRQSVCNLGGFKVGDQVEIVYTETQGKFLAMDMTAVGN